MISNTADLRSLALLESGTDEVNFQILFSIVMDDTFYLVCSALLIAILVWLINPFGKVYKLLSYIFKRSHGQQTSNSSEGVRSFEEMPGPKGLPYFGDVLNYLKTSEFKEQMKALQSDFEKYGPIFKRTIMGMKMVLIKDPKDVETVFKADGKYPMRPKEGGTVLELYRQSRNLPRGMSGL